MWPQGTQALGTMRGAGRNWVRSLGVLVVSEFHIVTLTAETRVPVKQVPTCPT